jgi:Zn-dependent peptidase ImmA (M78 family)
LQFDPYDFADALGINVIHRAIRSAHGLWIPEHNTIVIRSGLRLIHDRVALTHELGHAINGHETDDPKKELQADIFAAKKLINPERLQRLEHYRDDAAALALELGVTQRILRVFFEHCWHNQGGQRLHGESQLWSVSA